MTVELSLDPVSSAPVLAMTSMSPNGRFNFYMQNSDELEAIVGEFELELIKQVKAKKIITYSHIYSGLVVVILGKKILDEEISFTQQQQFITWTREIQARIKSIT